MRLRSSLASLTILGALMLGGCDTGGSAATPPTDAQTGQANGTVGGTTSRLVSPEEFEQAVAAGAVLVDVRTPAEFADGHLLGALNIDLQGANFAAEVSELQTGKTYAIYCRTGHRSAEAVKVFQAAGHGPLYDLAGGITAWMAAGLHITK
ncbi:MAG: rhodanese-like domain-containing protein [Candidatus Nanopelagicales bacterium]